MLTLAREWLQSYLPHCLMKINRVSFGIFSAEDHQRAPPDPFMPRARDMPLAIPFVGKDVPSRSSEFAHPDVIIGLTVLAYRYSGLRYADFDTVIGHVRATFDKEIGPYKRRKSSVMYEGWVLAAGGAIKGGFAAKAAREQRGGEADAAAAAAAAAGGSPPASPSTGGGGGGGGGGRRVAAAAAAYEKEGEVVPLRLLKRSNADQMAKLYALLKRSPAAIHWYLEQFIFPEYMRHQKVKLSASGQEVGGDLLFPRRIGFSGTPSDLLPVELGACGYEKGSDGYMVQVLTDPACSSFELLDGAWTVESLLTRTRARPTPDARAHRHGRAHHGLLELPGRQGAARVRARLVRRRRLPRRVRPQDDPRARDGPRRQARDERRARGAPRAYDQAHTTGMDIKHHDAAVAALTLGKDMVFRDLAQGAFRMRGIAKGQRIHVLLIPEVEDLIARELAAARLPRPTTDRRAAADEQTTKAVLVACVAWLIVNSMRVERVQFNRLCVQNVTNVFRKVAFREIAAAEAAGGRGRRLRALRDVRAYLPADAPAEGEAGDAAGADAGARASGRGGRGGRGRGVAGRAPRARAASTPTTCSSCRRARSSPRSRRPGGAIDGLGRLAVGEGGAAAGGDADGGADAAVDAAFDDDDAPRLRAVLVRDGLGRRRDALRAAARRRVVRAARRGAALGARRRRRAAAARAAGARARGGRGARARGRGRGRARGRRARARARARGARGVHGGHRGSRCATRCPIRCRSSRRSRSASAARPRSCARRRARARRGVRDNMRAMPTAAEECELLAREMVQEMEEEREKEQEQEQEREIEIEKYVDLAYRRDHEKPKPWPLERLRSREGAPHVYARASSSA